MDFPNDKSYKINKIAITTIFVISLAVVLSTGFPKKTSVTDVDVLESSPTVINLNDCLTNVDWVYPVNNYKSAWKFADDGTFNFSTKLFGGMSTWGTWKKVSDNSIEISYTRTSTGEIPDNQYITLNECDELMVGSTLYRKL